MAFETAMEPYHIGVCVCIFCGAVMVLFALDNKYTKTEDAVKNKVDAQNDVTISRQITSYENEEQVELSGSAVMMEVMEQDGSISIRINNELLNDIENINNSGLNFFSYMQEYGTEFVSQKVSLTATYRKKISLNENGEITEINYIVD